MRFLKNRSPSLSLHDEENALPLIGLSESQRNIRENALSFLHHLQQISDEERLRLRDFLAHKCFVVVISTADFETAYRIFSVLNTRGRNLSYADILKTQIIDDIPREHQHEYTNKNDFKKRFC